VNIFGEDIEEDADASRNDDEDAQEQHGEQAEVDQDDYDDLEPICKAYFNFSGFEWDFDLMLREKKAERKRKRRRRDAGIDIINDDDGLIAHMVNAMKNAAKEDRYSNTERKPALKKRKMLHDVKMMLLRMDMLEAMIDGGMMSAVSEWLAPLPDKSLPALEIRTELLKILSGFGNLDQGVLKQSGLGRAVMLLYKHPRETKENKAMAAHIIREWSRPIFQLDTDFRSVSREERVQRDLEHMSSAKKKRLRFLDIFTRNGELGPSDPPAASATPLGPSDPSSEPTKTKGREITRARVPRPSTKDYVVRPKSNVEGEFKGERKGKAFARLDKTQREFLERTRRVKATRAVGVSLQGRNLAL
uniref:TFIIS N-terminal domain-containing protein n=1 Tax=Angiostrongylus cantonensis TaxID=6313 RepID=A0A0K0DJA2_ANGCA